MPSDPIVDEIHKIREEIARRFNYDLGAICEYFRAQQAEREKSTNSQSDNSSKQSTNSTEAA